MEKLAEIKSNDKAEEVLVVFGGRHTFQPPVNVEYVETTQGIEVLINGYELFKRTLWPTEVTREQGLLVFDDIKAEMNKAGWE